MTQSKLAPTDLKEPFHILHSLQYRDQIFKVCSSRGILHLHQRKKMMNVECCWAVKFWQKRASNATAMASFQTLAMQLYYIFALRNEGTASKMSGSRRGKRIKILITRLSISRAKKINKLNSQTDFKEVSSFCKNGIVLLCQCEWAVFHAFIFNMQTKECILHTASSSEALYMEETAYMFLFHWEVTVYSEHLTEIFLTCRTFFFYLQWA